MGGYTVSELAKLSGVSVRTLHHYDEVGLLKPAAVGANGYRYYGSDELLRLQQILFHRELGFPLAEIKAVLDARGFDRTRALKAHRARLAEEARRFRRLIRTLDDTLAALEGDKAMDETKMWEGFDPKRQAEREAELVGQFGERARPAIRKSFEVMASTTQADFEARKAEQAEIEAGFAEALRAGAPADSERVQDLTRRLHAWVGVWWGDRPDQPKFAGLGRHYVDNPQFRARYEAIAPGLAEYLAEAMRVFAERELG